jgi:hypothetical protein
MGTQYLDSDVGGTLDQLLSGDEGVLFGPDGEVLGDEHCRV